MAAINFPTATLVDTAKHLQSREMSPVDLVKATLERISTLNPKLNAFTTVTSDYALNKAREAEVEITRGEYRGPLHGIPYTLKDLIDTKGIRTTYGYRSHQDYVRRAAQPSTDVWRKQGPFWWERWIAIFAGTYRSAAITPGLKSVSRYFQFRVRRIRGRLPMLGIHWLRHRWIGAHTSGVVWRRWAQRDPGLISRHNALGPSWSFDQLGPLAKTVADTALVLQAVAGHDPARPHQSSDPHSRLQPRPGQRYKGNACRCT